MPTALIIGASRGIGLELVRQYMADGWRVMATARDDAGRDRVQRGVFGQFDEVEEFIGFLDVQIGRASCRERVSSPV